MIVHVVPAQRARRASCTMTPSIDVLEAVRLRRRVGGVFRVGAAAQRACEGQRGTMCGGEDETGVMWCVV
jgi:hypothetical protein